MRSRHQTEDTLYIVQLFSINVQPEGDLFRGRNM